MKKTFVFAGPSAVGKTYIGGILARRHAGMVEQAKLYTTRQPREGDTDRIFVSAEDFDRLVREDRFIVHIEFGGNRYGFDHRSLYPSGKHLLVNAWPWLIPQFSALPHVVIIGMQAPVNWQDMLVERMKHRGDTPETIKKRLQLIKKDVAELEQNKELCQKHGRFFVIKDDLTVEKEILPWLETLL
jgi:guanylate kinase